MSAWWRDKGDVGREREVEQHEGVAKQVPSVQVGPLPLCACARGKRRGRAMARGSGREERACVCRDPCSCVRRTLRPNTAEEEGEGGEGE